MLELAQALATALAKAIEQAVRSGEATEIELAKLEEHAAAEGLQLTGLADKLLAKDQAAVDAP